MLSRFGWMGKQAPASGKATAALAKERWRVRVHEIETCGCPRASRAAPGQPSGCLARGTGKKNTNCDDCRKQENMKIYLYEGILKPPEAEGRGASENEKAYDGIWKTRKQVANICAISLARMVAQ